MEHGSHRSLLAIRLAPARVGKRSAGLLQADLVPDDPFAQRRLGPLAFGPWSIARLTAGSAVTRQAVTKHLHVLADAGLVRDARRGRERIWELELEKLTEARHTLDEISKRWDEALDRLKTFVE